MSQVEHQPGRSYYAVIPANVRYDKRVPPMARLLYGEITALCNDRGYCWASNAYFAELYDTAERTVRRWIEALVEAEHITSEVDRTPEGTTRKLRIVGDRGADKIVRPGGDKIVRHNNTDSSSLRKKPGPLARRVWEDAVEMIVEAGTHAESSARTLLGKLAKEYGEAELAAAVSVTIAKNPVVPHEYLIAVLSGGKKRNGRRHTNEQAADEWGQLSAMVEAAGSGKGPEPASLGDGFGGSVEGHPGVDPSRP